MVPLLCLAVPGVEGDSLGGDDEGTAEGASVHQCGDGGEGADGLAEPHF